MSIRAREAVCAMHTTVSACQGARELVLGVSLRRAADRAWDAAEARASGEAPASEDRGAKSAAVAGAGNAPLHFPAERPGEAGKSWNPKILGL